MRGSVKDLGCTVEGELFEAMPFQSILSTVHVVWGNVAVHPFTTKLPWSLHGFYITRFFKVSEVTRRRVQGEQ